MTPSRTCSAKTREAEGADNQGLPPPEVGKLIVDKIMSSCGGMPRHFSPITPALLEAAEFFTPINHLGKRRGKTAEKLIEFDLSFAGTETASLRPRGQKPRAHSLGMNPHSPSPEYRPVPCRLEARGANGEIASRRE